MHAQSATVPVRSYATDAELMIVAEGGGTLIMGGTLTNGTGTTPRT